MPLTPPASSPAARSGAENARRRRPQQPVQDEDEDEDSSEEESDDSEDSEDSEEDTEDEIPTTRRKNNSNNENKPTNRRPPPRPLNPKGSSKTRTKQKSSEATGSSAPSYEDPDAGDSTYRQDSYSHLPTPPSQRQPSPLRQQRNRAPQQPARARRPQRKGAGPPPVDLPSGVEDSYASSYSSSSTASSAGPWKPYAPTAAAAAASSNTPSRAPPMPGRRSRAPVVREPGLEPTQALVPRAPRTVVGAKIEEEDDEEEEEEGDGPEEGTEVEFVPKGPDATASRLPARGKKAALAVELKLNLEIEIELKASIHGDVTLELFN